MPSDAAGGYRAQMVFSKQNQAECSSLLAGMELNRVLSGQAYTAKRVRNPVGDSLWVGREVMTLYSATYSTNAHWMTLYTGAVDGASSRGAQELDYAECRERGWGTDPDDEEFGQFSIWPIREGEYLVTVETTVEYKGETLVPLHIRDDAETVYDGRILVPNQYQWVLTDNAGGVEPVPFRVDAGEEGWYRLVVQVKNREAARIKFDTWRDEWIERTKGLSPDELMALEDEAEPPRYPIEHWYLTVAERIGDLPDYWT